MALKHEQNLRIVGIILSIIFMALILPAAVPEHGIMMSLIYAGLGAGFINLAFFGMGRFISSIVDEEIKRRHLQPPDK